MRRTLAAVATVAALALTGCGADDDTDDATINIDGQDAEAATTQDPGDEASDDSAALEESVRTYTIALFGGDADTAYDLISERCRADMSRDQFDSIAEQGNHEFGDQEIEHLAIDQIEGDLARVSYGIGIPQFEREAQPWVREDGTWRWDAC